MTFPSLFGKYILRERICSGAGSEVLRAETTDVDGTTMAVALKRLLPGAIVDDAEQTRIEREARFSSPMRHPNVARVVDHGRIDGIDFIAREWVNGRDLASVLRNVAVERVRLPDRLVLFVAARVLDALGHAHALADGEGRPLGLYHGDLRPQSILLGFDGEVKVVGFGSEIPFLGELLSPRSRNQLLTSRHRLYYLAPEQIQKRSVGPSSDLYAVGLILEEALTGQRVQRERTASALLERMRGQETGGKSRSRQGLQTAIVVLLTRALAQHPSDRFQNAQEMSRAISDILPGAPDAGAAAEELGRFLVERFQVKARERLPVAAEHPGRSGARGGETGRNRRVGASESDGAVAAPRPAGEPRPGPGREVRAAEAGASPRTVLDAGGDGTALPPPAAETPEKRTAPSTVQPPARRADGRGPAAGQARGPAGAVSTRREVRWSAVLALAAVAVLLVGAISLALGLFGGKTRSREGGGPGARVAAARDETGGGASLDGTHAPRGSPGLVLAAREHRPPLATGDASAAHRTKRTEALPPRIAEKSEPERRTGEAAEPRPAAKGPVAKRPARPRPPEGPEKPEKPEPLPRPAPRSRAASTGILEVLAGEEGYIFVDGRNTGRVTPAKLQLPAGPHVIVILLKETNMQLSRKVVVDARSTTTLRFK